ncbi:pilus assembly protein [Reinekea marinisedimentorum]|uniref:Type IV pilus assembly protein PilY1 n=1 Tax=Reinekea marinisedimentorum TaxID=230495 RepID=A0A4R3HY82_9GAMM|nr:PilC/PilY family type IV pilus protein [Reinekea marinisedimentorum]TCS36439.1 type IV pilus assembly protein PilY1 [Reinekea marinisedimentorum]
MNTVFKPGKAQMLLRLLKVTAFASLSGVAAGATLSISDIPLSLQSSVQSNFYFVIDDSGSMAWKWVISEGGASSSDYNLSSLSTGDNSYVDIDANNQVLMACRGVNTLAYNPDKTYTPWAGEDDADVAYGNQTPTSARYDPYYSSTSVGRRNLTYDNGSDKVVGYFPWYDHNQDGYADLYYDIDGDGNIDTFLDQDGDNIFDGFIDLNGNGEYDGWVDLNGNGSYDTGEFEFESELECPDRGEINSTVNLGGGNSISENDFLRIWMVKVKDLPVTSTTETNTQTNYANWYSYYRSRELITKKALSEIIEDSTARMGLDTINRNSGQLTEIADVDNISTPINSDADDNKDALMEAVFKIQSSSSTPLRKALNRAGQYYKGTLSGYSSPILSDADGGSCQQNFTILMTDGYRNGSMPSTVGTGWNDNEDGNGDTNFDGGGYADTYDDTLADIAMYYYETDLDSNLDDEVDTFEYIDENDNQHMVTYTVAFGVTGTVDSTALYAAWDALPEDDGTSNDKESYGDFGGYLDHLKTVNTDADATNDTNPSFTGWPNPSSDATKIDDMFHTAVNGRGLYLNAQDPDELIDTLKDAVADAESRDEALSSASVSTGSITTTTYLYTALFNSANWNGGVKGFPINSDGTLDTTNAVTASIIPSHTQRNIVTWHDSNLAGTPFKWSDLSTAQQTTLGSEGLVEYIRGDTTGETNGTYRSRTAEISLEGIDTGNYLGDIVHSAVQYVANPQFLYPDGFEGSNYSAFRLDPDGDATNNTTDAAGINFYRTPMLYVGANDGMLHAFNVDSTDSANFGKELFAYVPSMVHENLEYLSDDTTYSHAYFVDGTPYIGDAYFDSEWHTVLVGGLRAGGQGIYAIDITDPDKFKGTESTAATTVLWEFGDDSSVVDSSGNKLGDDDLGYTYSQPTIAKLNNDKWVAIFGNGYNNTQPDGTIGGGTPVLYIVELETGVLIKKIDTGVNDLATPNGLSSPSTLDVDGDYIADYVYAGDLEGNLWKFDLTDDDPINWDVAYTTGSVNTPLFTACSEDDCDTTNRQPITVKPAVGFNDAATEYQIYFGTGTYFLDSDNNNKSMQTFYSVWDRMLSNADFEVFDREHLLQQKIIEEKEDGVDYTANGELIVDKQRVSTNYAIEWHSGTDLPEDADNDGLPDTHLGWYMDLYNTEGGSTTLYGERVVANPILRDDSVLFISTIPSDDPCKDGGDSWYMEVVANTGSRHVTPVIDVNGDNVVDDKDYLLTDSYGITVSSGRSNFDMLAAPPCLQLADGSEICYPDPDGSSVFARSPDVPTGRWMWREL